MDDQTRWEAMIWKAGQHLSKRLHDALDDPAIQSVTLDRDEAMMALGIIDGVVKTLEKGPPKPA